MTRHLWWLRREGHDLVHADVYVARETDVVTLRPRWVARVQGGARTSADDRDAAVEALRTHLVAAGYAVVREDDAPA